MRYDVFPDPMRLSTYTRVLPIVRPDDTTDGAHALLVNGLYGAMDVVDASEASSLVDGRPSCDHALEYEWGDVQVTIDGVGELTDRLRRHRSGGPTYERVMGNVAAINSLGIETTLRVLVDRERLGHLHEVVEDVRARGLEEDGEISHMSHADRDRFMELSGTLEMMAFASKHGWFELVS